MSGESSRRNSAMFGVLAALLTCTRAQAQGWHQEGGALVEPRPFASNQFATCACISGDTVFVGRAFGSHALYPFTRIAGVWQRGPSLLAPPKDNSWGWTCAMSGNTALFGADERVFVYVNESGTWQQQGPPLQTPGALLSYLGYPTGVLLGVDGDTAIIASNSRKAPGGPGDPNRNAAFVYVRTGSTWSQQGPTLHTPLANDDVIGASVAISGDTAAVSSLGLGSSGTAGAVTVFARSAGSWAPQGPALQDPTLHYPSQFGATVALSGDTLAIAGIREERGETRSSSVHLFERVGTEWLPQGPPLLVPSAPEFPQVYVPRVALAGDTLVLAAPGNVTVFTRHQGTWQQTAQLMAQVDAPTNAEWSFGYSVGLSQQSIVVGARYASLTDKVAGVPKGAAYQYAGAAYVFSDLEEPHGAAGAGGEGGSSGEAGSAGIVEGGAEGGEASAPPGSGTGGVPSATGGSAGEAGDAVSQGGTPNASTSPDERSTACGCRVAPRETSSIGALGLALVAVCGALRRRASRGGTRKDLAKSR